MLQAVFPTFRLTENPAVQLLFLLLQESVFFFQVGDTLRNKAEGYCWLQGRAPAGINFTLQETGGFGDSLSLLFKRSVPLCCATCPLYASSWSTATTETNFPFPECISPLNQCFQQNLIKYWTAGLGDHDLQEWSSCKWSGHQTRGLFLHLNGLHHCLKSQPRATAAGEINLLIVPRDVALQEPRWTQWMWAEWTGQAFLTLLYPIHLVWWVTSALPTTTEPLVQRGVTQTRAPGNTTAAYLAIINNNNCLVKNNENRN